MEASTVLVREIARRRQGVQIFGSVASLRSQLHVAMRKSRHRHCAAAISSSARQSAGIEPESAFWPYLARLRRPYRQTAHSRDDTGLSKICPPFEPLKRAKQ